MGQIFFENINTGSNLIFDCRSAASFCSGHFRNAVFIGDDAATDERLDCFDFPDEQTVFIVNSADNSNWSSKKTLLKNHNFLIWEDRFTIPASELDMCIDVDTEEFLLDYEYDEFYLIDVRPAELFEKGSLEYAQSIPAEDVAQAAIDLDHTKTYYVFGSSFEEALFAASVFKQNDFDFIRVVSAPYEILAEQLKKKKNKK